MRRRAIPGIEILSALVIAALYGCSGDGDDSAGAGGVAGVGGAGGAAGDLSPQAFLSPSSYDCTATGPFEPPPRPHPYGCWADPSCSSRLITVHRMATPFAPENSLSALRAAIMLGADIVETDLRLTADGEIVLIHDGTVDRTFEGSGDVSALTLAQIRAMAVHVPSGVPVADFSCEQVLTLADLFALSAGRVVVDLDVKDVQAGVLAAEYMRDHGLNGDAFLLCNIGECDTIRAAVADAPIMSRPTTPAELAGELDYDPPPALVHVDPTNEFLTQDNLDAIHGLGAKVFANGMSRADVEAVLIGRLEAYGEMFDEGLDVLQVENPHLALAGLGRLEPNSP